ncbi:MAG: periplasmic heavy metal sensor [Armatimonadetes bacterium]|nr:periplasmic heavy metal sensor [Armatimonadota bacterium]
MSKGALALVLALALTSGYLGMRLYSPERREVTPSPPTHPLVQLVGMTPQQTQQFADLEKQFVGRRDPLREKILARRAHLYELLQQDEPDQKQIEAEIQAISALQRQIQGEVLAHLLRVKSLLNEAQRQQFFATLAVTMCPAAVGSGSGPCLDHSTAEGTVPRGQQGHRGMHRAR